MTRACPPESRAPRNLGIAVALVCLLMGVGPRPAQASFSDYEIDPAHFAISFSVKHIGYANTLGMFLEGQGSFKFDEDARAVKDIVVTVTSDSVFTNHKRRDGHLKGKDFLHAEEHPEVRFVGTGSKATGENTGEITGDLTLLGVTKPITLQVTLNKIGAYPFGDGPPHVVGISASTTVKRSDFGMNYAVDNGWVGDEVNLVIEFEAIRR